MKKIIHFVIVSITLLMTTICTAQVTFKTVQKDFSRLSGLWVGALTYLDYSSGKPYTMPAELDIKRIGKTDQFVFSNTYPNEKSANSVSTLSISPDGKYIDKELIKSRRKLPNGAIEIITEELGKDGNDNKAATLRHTYTLGKTEYKNRKDVQFTGEKEWINRHEYSYKKKPRK